MKKTESFKEELLESLFVHKTLPLHREKSLEAENALKTVTKMRNLWTEEVKNYNPIAQKEGSVSVEKMIFGEVIRLQADFTADHWPVGAPIDGDYTNYGTAAFSFHLQEENWEAYNRISFQVCPRVETGNVTHLNVSVVNVGEIPVPDAYFREGATVFDLQNGIWNDCSWEFSSMGRDKITELTFSVFLSGQAADWNERLVYDVRDIRLECVENPEQEKGWECRKESISLSTAGYFTKGEKEAVANITAKDFTVHDAESNEIKYSGKVKQVKNERGSFQVLDFSAIDEEGLYFLQAGEVKSPVFPVARNICEEAVWKIINFVYHLRCGMPVQGVHGSCHMDSWAEHNGTKLSFSGGWHDAGDLSQQVVHTAEMVHAFLVAARRYRRNPVLQSRLLEEAQWGLDFVLRTRFGDGYRATSAGATRFTANKLGDFDDVAVRVFDHSYENFLFAGVEAYAAYVLRDADPALSRACLKAAVEDFGFAEVKFAQTGVEPAHMYEHTYNSGLSQYYAVIVWAAANIFQADPHHAKAICYMEKAIDYAKKLIACQEQGAAGLPFQGFFYRDESHRTIVHFNHQSREHQFMQALTLLVKLNPNHEEANLWRTAIARYAEYQKAILENTAPFAMIPAGVHRMDEPEDAALFPYLHILVDYEQELPHYRNQLLSGKQLDEKHVLKNFPVWFSFRGNSAVQLSSGYAAALAGRCLSDEEMRQIGREQLYWMWGKNPFGQSLQYGVGERYCSLYGVYVGERAGEVPVGIETYGDEDIPYWPQNNNATFKEVWIGTACRMLWLMSEYTH